MREGTSAARLVAILCPERSGSTLLATTLGSHSRVLAPPEMHLLRYPTFEAWRAGYPKAMISLRWLLERVGEPTDDAAIAGALAGLDTLEVGRRLLRLCGSGRFLVDKTPAYARTDEALDRLARLEPFVLWLVRHPLGVASSVIEREEKLAGAAARKPHDRRRPWWMRPFRQDPERRSLRAKLDYWCDLHARIESFLARHPKLGRIRIGYEELVRAPGPSVARLSEALGIEDEPGMLAPWRNIPEGLSWGIGDEKIGEFATFATERADAWRGRFEERVLNRRTRRLMARLGVTG